MTHPVPPGYPSRVTAYRRGIVIGLLLGLVALAGCSVEGRVQVRSAVAVDVDVTVRANRSPYCNADIVGLSTDPERGRGGVITSCRYRGTLDPSQLGWALGLASAGEYLVAVFNPLQVPASGPSDSTDNQLDAVDVVIVMPGSIQEANSGQVSDDQVRITDPEVLTLPGTETGRAQPSRPCPLGVVGRRWGIARCCGGHRCRAVRAATVAAPGAGAVGTRAERRGRTGGSGERPAGKDGRTSCAGRRTGRRPVRLGSPGRGCSAHRPDGFVDLGTGRSPMRFCDRGPIRPIATRGSKGRCGGCDI